MRKALVAIGVAVLVIGFAPAAGATGGGGGGGRFVFPPDSTPLGFAYPRWHGRYQIWENEIPTPENPAIFPDSPANCAPQRGGSVVFLGAFGADCAVPAHTPLVVGTASWECSTAEGLGETFRRLRRCAIENFDRDFGPSTFYQKITIDGVHVKRTRRWISVTPGEIIDFPEDNIWDAEPGPSRSVSKGFLFVLRGMPPGEHVVHAKIFFDGQHVLDVDWNLEVVA